MPDGRGRDRRAIEIGSPIAKRRKAAGFREGPNLVVGRAQDLTLLILADMIEYAANPAPPALIQAARTANPGNEALFQAAEALALSSTRALPTASLNLEKVVRPGVPFLAPAVFRSRLGRLELQVCSIELDGVGYGTGVLIGADYVLTNQHVVANVTPAMKITCRFDFATAADGKVINKGTAFPVQAAFVDVSPPSANDPNLTQGNPTDDECDYVLLQLADKIGDAPAGTGTSESADLRGWVQLVAGQIDPGDPVFVLQHPQSPFDWQLQPLKLTMGKMLALAGGGRRLRHDASTLPGSSGSPCFSASLSLVALHHAGGDDRYEKADFNQAIPIEKIVARLTRQKVTPFWTAAPPEPKRP
jgi:hypothetical protein